MRYRKLPVEIDAFRLTEENIHASKEWPDWMVQALQPPFKQGRALKRYNIGSVRLILIHTLEGDHRAYVGAWIVRGVHGELYPVKHEIFEETYEPVEEDE